MNFTYLLKVSLWVWLIAVMVLALLLTSCDPYEGLSAPTSAATAALATSTATLTPAETPTPAGVICIVRTGIDAGNLNIRTGAGVTFAVITTLNEGQVLTLTDHEPRDGWIQVTTAAGVLGWVNGSYCQVHHEQQLD